MLTTKMDSVTKSTHQQFLIKLNGINFEPIAFKLMHPEDGMYWSLAEVTQAIEQYRLFLLLNYLYPQHNIVPSQAIDRVWHFHILDTAKYREDCQTMFGKFMDHYPYFGMKDEGDREDLERAFAETQDLWMKHFGSEM